MDDYLDRVEAQLVALTEQGAHRRLLAPLRPEGGTAGGTSPNGGPSPRRFRTEFLAFAAGFAVVAAVVGVLLGLRGSPPTHPPSHPVAAARRHHGSHKPAGHHHKSSQTRPNSTTAAGGPVPQGFVPQSFTATGELTWWMLGDASCAKPPCTSIIRTTDGGQSFVGIPAPRAPLVSPGGAAPGTAAPGISELRFADANDAYAYGPALYVTHDGGQSWRRLDLGGSVTNISISASTVYAIVAGANGVGRLWSSPTTAERWVALPALADATGGLWAHDGDLFAQYADRVVVSRDGGRTFARYPAPSGLPCDFEEQAPPVVWAHCATGMNSAVWRSTDGGRTFSGARHTSTGGAGIAPEPNSAPFAAASSTTAVVGYQQLYRTTDGGATYYPVGPHGVTWVYLGFTDATHGVALGFPTGSSPSNEQLYYTTDGGVSYHPVPIG